MLSFKAQTVLKVLFPKLALWINQATNQSLTQVRIQIINERLSLIRLQIHVSQSTTCPILICPLCPADNYLYHPVPSNAIFIPNRHAQASHLNFHCYARLLNSLPEISAPIDRQRLKPTIQRSATLNQLPLALITLFRTFHFHRAECSLQDGKLLCSRPSIGIAALNVNELTVTTPYGSSRGFSNCSEGSVRAEG
jgi:hypothetical protein